MAKTRRGLLHKLIEQAHGLHHEGRRIEEEASLWSRANLCRELGEHSFACLDDSNSPRTFRMSRVEPRRDDLSLGTALRGRGGEISYRAK